jgi:tetratricopeptide (TPR) repeat protein
MVYKNIRIFLYIFFLSSGVLFSFDIDPVGTNVKSGVKKYKSGDYYGSLENFQTAEKDLKDDSRLEFNKGNAYYKLNDFATSAKYFEKASQSEDPALKIRSLYNLGNANAKQGDKKTAIKNYLDALKIDPNFIPARQNLELLRRKEDPKQNQNENEQNEEENKQNSPNQPPSSNQNPSQNKKQQNSSDNSSEEQDQNKKMTKSEAERILESSRQDNVKRRKLKERKPNYDPMFW